MTTDSAPAQPTGLTGRTALVIGCGGSIGNALCRGFAEAGARVMGVSKNEDRLRTLAEMLPREHVFVCADLETDQGRHVLRDLTLKDTPDIVILNLHARQPVQRLEKMAAGSITAAVEANLGYLPFLLPHVLKAQRAAHYGRFIGMSSEIAHVAGPGQAGYAAHKAAMEAVLRTLALEEGESGITANSIALGYVATEAVLDAHGPQTAERMQEANASRRVGTPHDVASAVLFLARAPYVTGQTLHVSGGLELGWWMRPRSAL